MTTQDYINAELDLELERSFTCPDIQRYPGWPERFAAEHCKLRANPTEVILLRAKVRELTDRLAGERARIAKVENLQCPFDPEDPAGDSYYRALGDIAVILESQ